MSKENDAETEKSGHEEYLIVLYMQRYIQANLGIVSMREFAERETAERVALEREKERDSLTGAFNRKHMDNVLEAEINQSRRNGLPLGLMFIDFDDFKQINTRFGHLMGDKVLIQAVKEIKEEIADKGILGRYGGEEFVAILPGSDVDELYELGVNIGNRCRKNVAKLAKLQYPQTVSMGVSLWRPKESVQGFYRRLDVLERTAKKHGKNRARMRFGDNKTWEVVFDS